MTTIGKSQIGTIKSTFCVKNRSFSHDSGTGTEPKRTCSGSGTFEILKTCTGIEAFILMNKVPELN